MDLFPMFEDFAHFVNREYPEICWFCKKLFPEEQPEYFAQRREGSRTRLPSEYPRISFNNLDLVLQGRLYEVSYPAILVMLHESSRFFSSLRKIRRKIFAVDSLNYSGDSKRWRVELSLGWMADVVLFVVDQVTEGVASPYSPADLSKFVIYNHVNFFWFCPQNFSEIPRNFSNQINFELVELRTENQRGLFLEDSNFEKLLAIMSKLPKLSSLLLDEFDLPKNWEQTFLDQMANSPVKFFDVCLQKENSCEINVPKLYELCKTCRDIIFRFYINEENYTIPTPSENYFHLELEGTNEAEESIQEDAYEKCCLWIKNREKTVFFSLKDDPCFENTLKIV